MMGVCLYALKDTEKAGHQNITFLGIFFLVQWGYRLI